MPSTERFGVGVSDENDGAAPERRRHGVLDEVVGLGAVPDESAREGSHAVQALEVSENFREMASGLLDIYLTSLSHRLNDVMKVLTVISTVFSPGSGATQLTKTSWRNRSGFSAAMPGMDVPACE